MVIGDPVTAANVATVNALGGVNVAPVNVISTANSTTSVLAGGAVFTGTSEDISGYGVVHVSVFASHPSATDGVSLQQSTNGTNWDFADTYTVAATTGKMVAVNPGAQFFRVVYTNGATLQTSFRLQTVYKRFYSLPSAARAVDAYTNETDLAQTQAFGMLWNGATWDRQPGNAAGGMVVTQADAATSSLANVASSATSVTLRAANATRIGLMIYNESTAVLYMKFGATASVTSYTVQLGPSAYYEFAAPVYSGIVDGIWSAANGNARVTEITP